MLQEKMPSWVLFPEKPHFSVNKRNSPFQKGEMSEAEDEVDSYFSFLSHFYTFNIFPKKSHI